MTLENRLRTHREKTARIAVLELEIEGLQEEIQLSVGIQESDEETIEGMTFRRSLASVGSGEDSKTEKIALNYENEQDKLGKPKDISILYEQLRSKMSELKRLRDETQPIEKALKGITDRQRLIIEEYYFNGNSWYTVGVRHQQVYGNFLARDSCRKIRDKALAKLKRILGE